MSSKNSIIAVLSIICIILVFIAGHKSDKEIHNEELVKAYNAYYNSTESFLDEIQEDNDIIQGTDCYDNYIQDKLYLDSLIEK